MQANTPAAVAAHLARIGHPVASFVPVREPLGIRMASDTSPLIRVDLGKDVALLSVGPKTFRCELSARIVARKILAHVFDEDAAERLDWALIDATKLRTVPLQFTIEQLRAWAARQDI